MCFAKQVASPLSPGSATKKVLTLPREPGLGAENTMTDFSDAP